MMRRPPRSTRTDTLFPTRRSSDLIVPGINRPIGLDAIVGLIPVVGDLLAALMSAYVIWEARNLGMSKWHLARMGANTLVDTAIGAIPLVGDLFDFAFRSNTRNLRIVRRHLDRHHPTSAVIEGEIHGGAS